MICGASNAMSGVVTVVGGITIKLVGNPFAQKYSQNTTNYENKFMSVNQ